MAKRESAKFLTALPVFNEAGHVHRVLDEVLRYSSDVLVVDDGSSDETPQLLAARNDVRVVTHRKNSGYGAALRSSFEYAREHGYDVIVTIDCDGQHEPKRIPRFVEACWPAGNKSGPGPDIVSGSRYLKKYPGDSAPPAARRKLNQRVSAELCRRIGLKLTDAFCGFKAYRVAALAAFDIRENGYGMPLELWVQAVAAGLSIVELPVPLIYLDEKRSFGGVLDDAATRQQYYHLVIDRAIAVAEAKGHVFTSGVKPGVLCGDGAG
jgi:glycosyltransferase involved in cell wall biosynthesis